MLAERVFGVTGKVYYGKGCLAFVCTMFGDVLTDLHRAPAIRPLLRCSELSNSNGDSAFRVCRVFLSHGTGVLRRGVLALL